MRVALLCPYAWSHPGGVQTHVAGLAAALEGRGVRADIVAPHDRDPAADGILGVGRSVPIHSNGSIQRVALSPGSAARVARLVLSGRYDVVHLHEPMLPAVCITAALLARTPLVGTFHMSSPEVGWYGVFGPLCRVAARRLTRRIAVSTAAEAHVSRVCPGRYELVPNGVDVARLSRLAPARSGGRVLFVGRAEPRKGLPVLVRAFAGLPGAPTLDLVGVSAAQVAPLVRDVPAAAARIRAHGRVDDAARDRLLAAADVLAVPSLGRESFGVVLVEGMAAGVPVVASDLPAYREVMPGSCGAFVRPGEPGPLRDAIAGLLERPDARLRLGAAGRAAAWRFDWSAVASRITDVYAAALAEHRARRSAGPARHGGRRPSRAT